MQIVNPEDVKEQKSIRQFLAMKDTVKMPEKDQIRYMDINKKEYQSRTHALGTVEQVLDGKSGTKIQSGEKGQQNNYKKKDEYKTKKDGTIDYQQPKPASRGREITGKIVRYDKRKQQLLVLVEGKEITIGMTPFQAFKYDGKKGQKILLSKNGKDYAIVEQ